MQRLKFHAVTILLILFAGRVLAVQASAESSISFPLIKQYAEFANASYQLGTQQDVPQLPAGYTLTHSKNIPGFEVTYFLATNDDNQTQMIVVRGTANENNALVDAALQLRTDKHTGVRLHNGFSQAALAIYEDVKPKLNRGYVINTTGHSLGGAVALILAMHLDTDEYRVGKVITFGQPKVTNRVGAGKFAHLDVIRVVTPKDVVPLVPPLDATSIDNIDIYWHLGSEVILLPGNDYAVLEGMDSMLRATKFTQEALSEKNITDHKMTLYLDMIDEKIPDSHQVEYENSLNLFNLF